MMNRTANESDDLFYIQFVVYESNDRRVEPPTQKYYVDTYMYNYSL